MSDQKGRYARIRYTAMGALAALAAVGAIAGAVALAANPRTKPHHRAVVANGAKLKSPTSPGPGKVHSPQPGSDRPFLADVQRLVSAGTISRTEAQVLDREIRTGMLDTQTLASAGFTQAQLQAVQQTLANTKRSMMPALTRPRK